MSDAPSRPFAGGEVPLIDNIHSPDNARPAPFEEVVEHIRQMHKIECPASCTEWEYELGDKSSDLVEIRMRCECGEIQKLLRIPHAEFAAHAEKVLNWPGSKPADEADENGSVGDDS